jgi:hypothetical protein
VETINYKLSTSTYLKLGETNIFVIILFLNSSTPSHSPSPIFIFLILFYALSLSLIILFFSFSFLGSHSLSLPCGSARTRQMRACVRVDADPSASTPIYINPICVHYFCSFSLLPLVGIVGFAWQRPF